MQKKNQVGYSRNQAKNISFSKVLFFENEDGVYFQKEAFLKMK